jgi:hypothetical protein
LLTIPYPVSPSDARTLRSRGSEHSLWTIRIGKAVSKNRTPNELRSVRAGNSELEVSAKGQFRTIRKADRSVRALRWALATASGSKVISVVFALLVTSNLNATDSSAGESQAAICSINVQKFVEEIDGLLIANHKSVSVFDYPIRKYLPVKGCNADEVISISKHSKFFVEAYDWSPAYTIVFRNSKFDITFGLRKDTGNIQYPAAQTRLPRR